MNREDVLRMAREAELICEETAQTQWKEEYDLTLILQRFATLVASAEREACLKFCDEVAEYFPSSGFVGSFIASKIRDRGQA